jgi:hypothetical protein
MAAPDRGNKTWSGRNSLSMTPWAYYALNSGNASSTRINRGYGCSSCVHPKMGNRNCPLNLAKVMEHISGCMAHFLGLFHTPQNRADSIPPSNTDTGSRIIQTDNERKISKMRRSPGNQCAISVEEHEELVNTVQNLQIQLRALSTQVLSIT